MTRYEKALEMFGGKCWLVTMAYRSSERPDTKERAEKDLREFLQKYRAECKRERKRPHYIAVTSNKNDRPHHHVIITDIEEDALRELWRKGPYRDTTIGTASELELAITYIDDNHDDIPHERGDE